MSDTTSTDRELLLQLNDKLTTFIAESKADRATLNIKMDAVKDSVAVLNHNSTLMADRIGKLENNQKTATDYLDFAKKLGIGLSGSAVFIATILEILHLLGCAI